MHDNPLHDELEEAHSKELRAALNLDQPAFSLRPDEVDVRVMAGDLLIGDSRVLHAAHAKQSDAERTVITLFFYPDVAALSEPLQAAAAADRYAVGAGLASMAGGGQEEDGTAVVRV